MDIKRTDTSGISATAEISVGTERIATSPCPIYPVDTDEPTNLFNSALIHLGAISPEPLDRYAWGKWLNPLRLKILLRFQGLN